MNNSEQGYTSGSSSDTPTRNTNNSNNNNNDIQSMLIKFTRTIDDMDKKFKEQYDKLSGE